jgi:hypothetical protein
VAASSRPVSADRSLSPVICLPDGRPTPAFGRSLRPARQQRIPIAVASLLYLIAGTCTTACPWEGEGDRYVVVTSPDLSAIARSRAVRVHGLGKTAPAEAPTNQRVLLALSLHCPERLSRRRLLMAEPFEHKCVLRATNHDKRPCRSTSVSNIPPAREFSSPSTVNSSTTRMHSLAGVGSQPCSHRARPPSRRCLSHEYLPMGGAQYPGRLRPRLPSLPGW